MPWRRSPCSAGWRCWWWPCSSATTAMKMATMARTDRHLPASSKDVVAVILAIGLATAVNMITFAVLYDALFSAASGLSENATQLLTAAFGGIIGILGAHLGYRAGVSVERARNGDVPTVVVEPEVRLRSDDVDRPEQHAQHHPADDDEHE